MMNKADHLQVSILINVKGSNVKLIPLFGFLFDINLILFNTDWCCVGFGCDENDGEAEKLCLGLFFTHFSSFPIHVHVVCGFCLFSWFTLMQLAHYHKIYTIILMNIA